MYVVSTLKRSGPSHQLLNIVKNLDTSKFEVAICTLSAEPRESIRNKFLASGFTVYTLGLSRIKGFFLNRSRLNKLIDEFKPHVLHSQGIRSDYYCSRIKKVKTVATLRNFPFEDYIMTYGSVRGQAMANFHLKTLRRIDSRVCVSEAIYDKLIPIGIKFLVIQNGSDTEEYFPVLQKTKESLRKKLNVPQDAKIFVSVGHLSTRKNPLEIIEAFSTSGLSQAHLLIFVGDGPLMKACTERISGLDRVQLLGRQENVNEYLQLSDCFISASKSEGLPNSVLEAISCGLPTILSDIPQHLEVFKAKSSMHDFYRLGLQEELKKSLCRMAPLLGQQSSVALGLAETKFSAKIMSGKYQKVYLDLLR